MPVYPLPKATVDAVAALPVSKFSNLGLYMDRFTSVHTADDEEVRKRKKDEYELTDDAKKYKDAPLDYFSEGEGAKLLAACAERHKKLLEEAHASRGEAGPQSRCIVGLGDRGAREVGIRLDHLYGFPLIPGSSLKGVARMRGLVAVFDRIASRIVAEHGRGLLEQLEHDIEGYDPAAKNHKTYLDNQPLVESFRRCFGTQGEAGAAIFFDALPSKVVLELDIMNPHYPEYYSAQGKNKPPADYQSPIPIYFLAVGKESRFRFGVAARKGDTTSRDQAWKWLCGGLTDLGVGAKTTSGYGLFTKMNEA